jgi:DNA-binding HxlR family transcriptional regulator
MANATIQLVEALRETAKRLRSGAHYAWGNHGACNCGNLIQVVGNFTQGEVLRYAHTGVGEWTELAEEFCPITNVPLKLILKKLEDIGLTPTDVHHIEYLTDREVLNNLEGGFRWLKRNKKEDAIAYFEAFANLLEDKMTQEIKIDLSTLTARRKSNVLELA